MPNKTRCCLVVIDIAPSLLALLMAIHLSHLLSFSWKTTGPNKQGKLAALIPKLVQHVITKYSSFPRRTDRFFRQRGGGGFLTSSAPANKHMIVVSYAFRNRNNVLANHCLWPTKRLSADLKTHRLSCIVHIYPLNKSVSWRDPADIYAFPCRQ